MFLYRKYATATHVYFPVVKRAVVDFAVGADWTPAAGDVKISIDGAAAANVTNLPTAIAMGNTAYWDISLTTGELTGKKIMITIADAATKVVEDQAVYIETYGNASAEILVDLSVTNIPANVTQLLGTAWLTPGTAGTPDVNTKLAGGTAWGSGAITAAAIAADAITAAKLADGAIDWATFAADVLPKLGVASYGVLDAGGAASFTLPAGQRALVAIGDALWLTAKGAPKIILTYNSGTGVGTVASNFDSTGAASDAFVVFKQPHSEPLVAADFSGNIPANIKAIADVTGPITGNGSTIPFDF